MTRRALIAALLAAVGTWGATAFADGHLQPVEWFGLLSVLGVALGAQKPRVRRRRHKVSLHDRLTPPAD
jgi:hypothetical protein